MALTRWVGRAIGLDVHRDFCVVAICEDGRVKHWRSEPGPWGTVEQQDMAGRPVVPLALRGTRDSARGSALSAARCGKR
jgi:hypothetical protein